MISEPNCILDGLWGKTIGIGNQGSEVSPSPTIYPELNRQHSLVLVSLVGLHRISILRGILKAPSRNKMHSRHAVRSHIFEQNHTWLPREEVGISKCNPLWIRQRQSFWLTLP